MVGGDGGGREGLAQAADRHTPQEAYVAHMGKVRMINGGGRVGERGECMGKVRMRMSVRPPRRLLEGARQGRREGLVGEQEAYVTRLGKVRMGEWWRDGGSGCWGSRRHISRTLTSCTHH